jgi:hypothetical protein
MMQNSRKIFIFSFLFSGKFAEAESVPCVQKEPVTYQVEWLMVIFKNL